LNEKKFGSLQEEQPTPEPILVEEVKPSPIKKVLSYLRRDA
jgi:hypothetical protein